MICPGGGREPVLTARRVLARRETYALAGGGPYARSNGTWLSCTPGLKRSSSRSPSRPRVSKCPGWRRSQASRSDCSPGWDRSLTRARATKTGVFGLGW